MLCKVGSGGPTLGTWAANSAGFLTNDGSGNISNTATTGTGNAVEQTSPTLLGTINASGATALDLPSAAGASPTSGGDIRFNSTQEDTVAGGNGSLTGSFPRLIYWAHPTSDIICAHGGDTTLTFSYGATACNNTAGTDSISGSKQSFTSAFSIPANFLVKDKMLRVVYDFGLFTPATADVPNPFLELGSTAVYTPVGGVTASNSQTNVGLIESCLLTANSAVGSSATVTSDCTFMVPGWTAANMVNSVVPVAVATNGSLSLTNVLYYAARGIASGTYTSGITATGTTGRTCSLTSFNGTGGSGATATVALTGTNTIASSTALVITNTGSAYTATSTSATVGDGTATCSGTPVLTTVLGGPQGNAMQLRSMTVEELN